MKKTIMLTACLVLGAAFAAPAQSRLSRAAGKGDIAAVENYIERGLDVNDVDEWGWTPLLWSVFYQHPKMIDYLLAKGADPNYQSTLAHRSFPKGSTALMITGVYGTKAMAKQLLKAGAKPGLVNSAKKTALEYAVESQQEAVSELLEQTAGK